MRRRNTLATGRVEREWAPLWKNDLWSSANFLGLNTYPRGIYLQLWTRCRDGIYAGQFVWPNGVPMSIKDIVLGCLKPGKGDRVDRIKEAIFVLVMTGMLYITDIKDKKDIRLEKIEETSGLRDMILNWICGEPEAECKTWVLVVRNYARKSAQGNLDIIGKLSGGMPNPNPRLPEAGSSRKYGG